MLNLSSPGQELNVDKIRRVNNFLLKKKKKNETTMEINLLS